MLVQGSAEATGKRVFVGTNDFLIFLVFWGLSVLQCSAYRNLADLAKLQFENARNVIGPCQNLDPLKYTSVVGLAITAVSCAWGPSRADNPNTCTAPMTN